MRAFLLIAMLAAAAFGQTPGVFPWWDTPLARTLNLSSQQERQIRDTIRDYRDRLIEQRAEVQKAEGDFTDLINEPQVNQQRAQEVIDRLVETRADLTRSFSELSLKMRAILTADQWQKLQERHPRTRGWDDRRGPRGPKPPGGPGGRPPREGPRERPNPSPNPGF